MVGLGNDHFCFDQRFDQLFQVKRVPFGPGHNQLPEGWRDVPGFAQNLFHQLAALPF